MSEPRRLCHLSLSLRPIEPLTLYLPQRITGARRKDRVSRERGGHSIARTQKRRRKCSGTGWRRATSDPPSHAPKRLNNRICWPRAPFSSSVVHPLHLRSVTSSSPSLLPTTAMREEVGRSIGLSARKVQIWFQNQRQKARRPGSQSDTSQPGAPHYSSFPNAPSSYPSTSEYSSHGERVIPHAYSGYPPSEQFLGSVETPPQLLGPGMPGRSVQRGRPVLHLASTLSPGEYSRELPAPPFSSRSLPGPRTLDSENTEGTFPFHRTHGNDPSRTLAPLLFNQPSRCQDLPSSSFMLARSAPTTSSHPFLASPSPSPTFAHNVPEQSQSYSSSALGLPPPFTLQPQPQWDSSSSHRPHSSSWSRSGSHSTRDSSSPPTSFLKEPSPDDDGDTPRLGPAQPSRSSGRYDPVRAVFVPTSDAPPGSSSPGPSSTPPS
ncbi:hypothetical protein B0H13DRAFT_2487733 [Mycena leptocephala]|nr:hypothetical protein B0H13DRAFT_2487733 [Mycena leptocephala]